MKYLSCLFFFLLGMGAFAQSIERVFPPKDTATLVVDSLVVVAPVDSISKYDRLMQQLGDRVMISPELRAAYEQQLEANRLRVVNGYRLRIYFDNRQIARKESETVAQEFLASFPDMPVYRSYVNPYFKVTVGDFRTKSEALQFMEKIHLAYPAAFLVREPITVAY
ncbi:MAG: SPOR domain-containing protein [Bacteroidales bacterium]|nr:SPOR domain-containing protein [Bacteroidales bacterium]